MRVLRALVTHLCSIDWAKPWTAGPRGGGPTLDDELEQERVGPLDRCMPEGPRSLP